jgi:glycosyltransferase involved in cell wall biosynthesis
MSVPDVSIVVPVHNEEQILTRFVKDIGDSCKKLRLNYELLLIENGSTDQTRQIMKNITKSSVINLHLIKPDYGEAMLVGIQKSRGKYVVVFNVDYWEEKFLAITQANLLGYDMVIGSKRLPGSDDRRHWSRRLITGVFNIFLKIVMKYPGTDTHGIKVFEKEKMKQVVKACKTRSGIVDSEMMIRAYRAGLKVLELPTTVVEIRPTVFSPTRLWQTPKDIWGLYKALNEN